MTPRALDWRIIERKLMRMRRLLRQLVALGAFDRARLDEDEIATLAAERILTLLVDLAFATNSHIAVNVLADVPDSYRHSFELARKAGLIDRRLAEALAPAAGMRNVLVHGYDEVDYDKVQVALAATPELFGEYVTQVSRWLADRVEATPD
ncbi:MAG: DUF86 domain-containing protein [Pseudonocardia sp.]|nr:DUF86 domain-containing protein [Pseudonocardia sp.]